MKIILTEDCHCGSTHEYYDMCDDCGGTGEKVTEEGRTLLKFIRKYLFSEEVE